MLFKWWPSCLGVGGWKGQKDMGSSFSVLPLTCHLALGKSVELIGWKNVTSRKREMQNWNIAAKSEQVCLGMSLLHFLGVVVCDLILVTLSTVQAHAAVQFSYQTAVCSWLTRGRASQRGHGRWKPCLMPRGGGGHLFLRYVVFQPNVFQIFF